MTAEEYFRMPVGPPYFQLIDGELFMSPSPLFYHQKLAASLSARLRIFAEENDAGEVIAAPSDVQLGGENVFQPDIYFVRKERLSIIDRQGPKGAPDLVVEIISPSTSRLDLGRKKLIFAQSGVIEFWAVFPERCEVEIYLLSSSADTPASTLTEADELTTALLPGFSMPLAKLLLR